MYRIEYTVIEKSKTLFKLNILYQTYSNKEQGENKYLFDS